MVDYQSAGDAATVRNASRGIAPALAQPPRLALPQRIIRQRRNAWRTAIADEVKFLVDGSAYFSALDRALREASNEIWIVGWDFNPSIRLRPGISTETLGELLLSLVDNNPDLKVRILIWGMGPIYSGKSLRLFGRNTVSTHPQISLRFDFGHPLRACHHQKLVSIDGCLAFLGGIDLTARRWDEPDHRANNPLRRSPDGIPYEPVHDIQCLVSGDAALMIREVARRRWKRATGEQAVETPAPAAIRFPLTADMVKTPSAVALTEPGLIGKRGRYEARRLTRDAIATAKRLIYIETQYLASTGVARAIAKRLKEPHGPEIVVVVTKSSHGFIEKLTMGNNRDRLIRRLKRADRYNRLKVMFAVVPDIDGNEQEIVIHSKLIIVDDVFVRIGSSNLNNRSEGLDTECDLALEANCTGHQDTIRQLRHQLMAEHLGAELLLLRELEQTHTMLETIEALNVGVRGLREFKVDVDHGETTPLMGTTLIDPRRPVWPLQKLRLRLRRILGAFG